MIIRQKLRYDHETKGCFVFKLEDNIRAVDAIYIRKDALRGITEQCPASITLVIQENQE